MTAPTFTTHSHATTIARRPAVDVLVERLARSLLAWSDRRANANQLSNERVTLLRENQRNSACGGSALGK
jgi:hypothetical protein